MPDTQKTRPKDFKEYSSFSMRLLHWQLPYCSYLAVCVCHGFIFGDNPVTRSPSPLALTGLTLILSSVPYLLTSKIGHTYTHRKTKNRWGINRRRVHGLTYSGYLITSGLWHTMLDKKRRMKGSKKGWREGYGNWLLSSECFRTTRGLFLHFFCCALLIETWACYLAGPRDMFYPPLTQWGDMNMNILLQKSQSSFYPGEWPVTSIQTGCKALSLYFFHCLFDSETPWTVKKKNLCSSSCFL